LLISDGDDAETVLIERDRFFLGGGKVAFIERTLRAVDLISGSDRENLLDRASQSWSPMVTTSTFSSAKMAPPAEQDDARVDLHFAADFAG
jgi:hypothetical protein